VSPAQLGLITLRLNALLVASGQLKTEDAKSDSEASEDGSDGRGSHAPTLSGAGISVSCPELGDWGLERGTVGVTQVNFASSGVAPTANLRGGGVRLIAA
jgi:hypothetical protein